MNVPLDRDDGLLTLMAAFNLLTDNGTVVESVAAYVDIRSTNTPRVKVIASGHGPNNYEQHWTFTGPEARRDAVNKLLHNMGFGQLEKAEDE
jgi:hypothetical protein